MGTKASKHSTAAGETAAPSAASAAAAAVATATAATRLQRPAAETRRPQQNVSGRRTSERGPNAPNKIDLLFVLDTTGSMGSYIQSAQRNIKQIVRRAQEDGATDVRFGLVSYKDYNKGDQLLSFSRHTDADADAGALEHKGAKVEGAKAELARPPAAAPAAAAAVEVEAAPVLSRGLRAVMRSARPGRLHRRRGGGGGGGNGFADGSAARIFDFTNDMAKMQSYVDCQRATGGGDGPEAVATALHCADLMAWREDAARIAVLITDAPPHGIEQSGSDNFPDGDPGCRDCLEIARSLADKDVTCYTVACEPSVTQSYVYCRDFLAGVAEITGGMLVPLKSAAMLTDLILASCKEGADLAKAQAVVQAALEKAKSEDPTLRGDDLAARAASKLAAAGVRVHQTRETANAYAKFSKKNVVLFADDAATLRSCRERLTPAAAPAGWDAGLESQQIRSEVATLSADQCSRMMTKHRRKAGWGY